jgi:hypothetical protein
LDDQGEGEGTHPFLSSLNCSSINSSGLVFKFFNITNIIFFDLKTHMISVHKINKQCDQCKYFGKHWRIKSLVVIFKMVKPEPEEFEDIIEDIMNLNKMAFKDYFKVNVFSHELHSTHLRLCSAKTY